MRKGFLLLSMIFGAAIAADAPRADATAKLRVAGVFIAGFNVWRADANTPRCAATGKPWLRLECGFVKCPKPRLLGIPLELDYTNWRKSPRVTEVELEADKPLALHLKGNFARGMDASTARISPCSFDARFTPRAGAMYEVSLDPTEDAMFGSSATPPEGGRCVLKLSEIRLGGNGIHERLPVEGALVDNCLGPGG